MSELRLDDIDENFVREHPDEAEALLAAMPERTHIVCPGHMYACGNWHRVETHSITGNGPSIYYWTIPDHMREHQGPHDLDGSRGQ